MCVCVCTLVLWLFMRSILNSWPSGLIRHGWCCNTYGCLSGFRNYLIVQACSVLDRFAAPSLPLSLSLYLPLSPFCKSYLMNEICDKETSALGLLLPWVSVNFTIYIHCLSNGHLVSAYICMLRTFQSYITQTKPDSYLYRRAVNFGFWIFIHKQYRRF